MHNLIVAILFLSSFNVLVAFPRPLPLAKQQQTRRLAPPPQQARILIHHHHRHHDGVVSSSRGGGEGGGWSLAASSPSQVSVDGGGDVEEEAKAADGSDKRLFQFYTLPNGMCPYAARTEMTLLELGLPFDTVGVNTRKREEWYLQINPSNKVPAIQNTLDGTIVYESAICNEYLSDYARQLDDTVVTESSTTTTRMTRQQDADSKSSRSSDGTTGCWKLMPMSAADRATLRLLQHHVDTVLNPAVFTLLMNKDPEKEAVMKETLENALEILQQNYLMARGGGPYLMGRDFSLADIHALPFIMRLMIALKHYKDYDVLSSSSSPSSSSSLPSTGSRFQPLLDWYQLCYKRPSVQAVSKTKEQIVQVYDMFMDMNYAFGGLNKNKA